MEPIICQSCGMPMAAAAHFGTHSNHTSCKEYCCFCYREGTFTNSGDFEDGIATNLKYHDENEWHDGRRYTASEAEVYFRTLLPTLKRWSSHTYTHMEYYKSVNRVMQYIDEHLSEPITLSEIAQVAHISDYHFHRIFKAILRESPGEYIQRLRLEKAIFKLHSTALSLTEIAEQTGYQSAQALSKVLKKKYKLTSSQLRKQMVDLHVSIDPIVEVPLHPEIKEIAPKEVVYVQIANPFKRKDAYIEAWNQLIRFVGTIGIPNEEYEYISLSRDMASITNSEQFRMFACIATPTEVAPSGKFGVQTIEGGRYAVFKHTGAYAGLENMYCNIYRYWIPQHNYILRDNMSFERYINTPNQVKEGELITEIYIPIE